MPMTAAAQRHSVGPRRGGAHGLLVAETDRESRVGTSAWLENQLATGSKVYYKGWLEEGPESGRPWIAGPGGPPRAAHALSTGQMEFLDFPTVVQRCGGSTEGLYALLRGEVERGLDEGWPRIAMSQESARRPMADDDEASEFARQEAAYDDLAARWPLTTLCQLTLDAENDAAAWETAAIHHHLIVDPQWSCRLDDGYWRLGGTIDAHVTPRFGAALFGALRAARSDGHDADLHIDLGDVEFLDLAFAQTLFLTARSVSRHQHVVLHGVSPFALRVLDAVGRPPSVLLGGGRGT